MPRTWAEWKCKASTLDNQWRQFNATCPQMMMTKNPVTTSSHSAALPCSAPPSLHPSPAPPTGSSKSAAELQPMDLDCMKSKDPPSLCYNCPETHTHELCNADVLSPATIKMIME